MNRAGCIQDWATHQDDGRHDGSVEVVPQLLAGLEVRGLRGLVQGRDGEALVPLRVAGEVEHLKMR